MWCVITRNECVCGMLVRTSHHPSPLAAPHLLAQLHLNWPCPLAILADGPGSPPPVTTTASLPLSEFLLHLNRLSTPRCCRRSRRCLRLVALDQIRLPRFETRHYPFPSVISTPDAGAFFTNFPRRCFCTSSHVPCQRRCVSTAQPVSTTASVP